MLRSPAQPGRDRHQDQPEVAPTAARVLAACIPPGAVNVSLGSRVVCLCECADMQPGCRHADLLTSAVKSTGTDPGHCLVSVTSANWWMLRDQPTPDGLNPVTNDENDLQSWHQHASAGCLDTLHHMAGSAQGRVR